MSAIVATPSCTGYMCEYKPNPAGNFQFLATKRSQARRLIRECLPSAVCLSVCLSVTLMSHVTQDIEIHFADHSTMSLLKANFRIPEIKGSLRTIALKRGTPVDTKI